MRTKQLISLWALYVCGASLCLAAPEPEKPITVRVASYNVEFGRSTSPEQVGEMFKPYKLDLIGFDEAPDGDWTARVGKVLGMEHSYVGKISSANHKDKYKSILSRTPLAGTEEYTLTGRGWNPASVVRAVTKIDGVSFAFYSLHICRSGATDGHAYSLATQVLSKETTERVIVVGDFNNKIGDPAMKTIEAAGFAATWKDLKIDVSKAFTYNAQDPKKNLGVIDHILYNSSAGAKATDGGIIELETPLSDHKPIWAEIAFPRTHEFSVRIMSYNIHRGGTVLGRQPLSQTVKVIQAAKADVVGVQETRSPQGVTAEELAQLLGWNLHVSPKNTCIVTRHEIVERHDSGIKIKLPSGQEVYVFNLHLPSNPYQPYQLLGIRPKWHKHGDTPFIKTEAEAIAAAKAARGGELAILLRQIRSLPDKETPVFVVGDFNEPSHLDWTEDAAESGRHPIKVAYPSSLEMSKAGFSDAWRRIYPDEMAKPGYTWTPIMKAGDPETHHDRIDFVYFRGKGTVVTDAKIVGESKENADLVVTPYPSDHRAVVATFTLPNQPGKPVQVAVEKAVAKPNILFIMVDDLGKEWISGYGSEDIKTPNIDALAAGGMTFNNAYSMPSCTSSRATLLTGKYPWRNGYVSHWDVPRWGVAYFDWKKKQNTTFARLVKDLGYATCAAGKWQINDFRIEPQAMKKHGFDDWAMWTGWEEGNAASETRFHDAYVNTPAGSKTYAGAFGPDIYTDHLIRFMREHKEDPMCLYYPMALVHRPWVATPDEPRAKSRLDRHKAMVRYADKMVGRLIQSLDELKIRDRTIVIFTTDNGTTGGRVGFTATRNGITVPGAKGELSEAGVCAPFIVNCPGLVPAGTESDAITDFSDMLPTFLELGGGETPEDLIIDGTSIAPVILGKEQDSARQWIMGIGGGAGRITKDGVRGAKEFGARVIRDKQHKVWVSEQKTIIRLHDLQEDPWEKTNLLDSELAAHKKALQKFQAVVDTLPDKDAYPLYEPRAANPWDKQLGDR